MTKTHGHTTHQGRSSTYSSWENMRRRCDNPAHEKYATYGAVGITYQESWKDFANFLADMGKRPFNKTLDRVDNSKGYSKENCRWADPTEQVLNRKIQKSNTSGKKGVSWHASRKKWRAQGTAYGIVHPLYYGDSFEAAVAAREKWEAENNVPGI